METELEGGSTRDTCRQIVYTTWQQETSEISSKKKKSHMKYPTYYRERNVKM